MFDPPISVNKMQTVIVFWKSLNCREGDLYTYWHTRGTKMSFPLSLLTAAMIGYQIDR